MKTITCLDNYVCFEWEALARTVACDDHAFTASKLGMIYLVAVFLNRDEHGEKVTKTNPARQMTCFETRAGLPWPCIGSVPEGVSYLSFYCPKIKM